MAVFSANLFRPFFSQFLLNIWSIVQVLSLTEYWDDWQVDIHWSRSRFSTWNCLRAGSIHCNQISKAIQLSESSAAEAKNSSPEITSKSIHGMFQYHQYVQFTIYIQRDNSEDNEERMLPKRRSNFTPMMQSPCNSLFWNKRFMLDEMTQRNASKFAIFYV